MKRITSIILVLFTTFHMMACTKDVPTEQSSDITNMSGKTLVAYYSFTGDSKAIVQSLISQISADVVEIQPAEEGIDYAANNYAIGSQLIADINSNPTSESSYPAIKSISVNMKDYANVIIVCPLWWSHMAAPMQTFLFQYSQQMAGKNIGLIVSSHSSGISSVVADAKRLLPKGNFFGESLWINHSNFSNRTTLIVEWLSKTTLIVNVAGSKSQEP